MRLKCLQRGKTVQKQLSQKLSPKQPSRKLYSISRASTQYWRLRSRVKTSTQPEDSNIDLVEASSNKDWITSSSTGGWPWPPYKMGLSQTITLPHQSIKYVLVAPLTHLLFSVLALFWTWWQIRAPSMRVHTSPSSTGLIHHRLVSMHHTAYHWWCLQV